MLVILHNNRCGKSRECVAFVENSNRDYEIVDYIKTPLKFTEIKALLKKLKLNPIDVVRTNEPEWLPYKNDIPSPDDIVRLIAKHPILLQRPIVINGSKAIIARPADHASQVF